MKDWFSADTHFFHWNIARFCGRPFSSLKEMNETIINNHNSLVAPDDNYYFLGDFAFASQERIRNLLLRLNGKKHIILGNHDKKLRKKPHLFLDIVEWIKELHVLTIQDKDMPGKKVDITLCHYAMRTWHRSHHSQPQLHGHSHGGLPDIGLLQMDVGVDANDFKPVSYEQIKQWMLQRSKK